MWQTGSLLEGFPKELLLFWLFALHQRMANLTPRWLIAPCSRGAAAVAAGKLGTKSIELQSTFVATQDTLREQHLHQHQNLLPPLWHHTMEAVFTSRVAFLWGSSLK
jgi:hypothetical protein